MAEDAAIAIAAAGGGSDADQQGGHCLARNLADEFLQVDGHEV